MNRAQLLQHFDTLAATPGAVTKIRNTILSLAAKGRLLPQDVNDDPAELLVANIRSAKQQLARKLGIKVPAAEIPLTDEDKSFVLPNGWIWVKLADLCIKLGAGKIGRA